MTRKYTVNELKDIINLSHQGIYDRVKLNKFNTVKERVDSRMTTFILFNDDEWNKLIQEVGYRIKDESTLNQFNNQINDFESSDSTVLNQSEKQSSQTELAKIMFEGFNNFTQQLNQLRDGYEDKVLNLSLQTKLLEDSEKRKENEYLKQIAEFKAENERLAKEMQEKTLLLQDEIKSLQDENEKLKQKTFFGIKIGKK